MGLGGLDLNLLVALDALFAEKSVSRAGERRLHLSQPATSGALARLREVFQDQLLVPVGHKLVLTPVAEALVDPVRNFLLQAEAILNNNVVNLHQANPNPDNVTQNIVGLYASDVWKVNRRLTVSHGVRWNPFLPMAFKHSDTYNFSLSNFYAGVRSTVVPTAPAGLLYIGDKGVNGKSGMNNGMAGDCCGSTFSV
jgi:hypothetical protein